jgi:Peptidase A4 family
MRRSWPVIFATIIFLCGTALAAGPATAATAVRGPTGALVWPGGPGGHMTTIPREGLANVTAQTVVSSTNWAGYAATGTSGQFTSVSASWVQPAATCTGSGDQYSAFWVGLDGYSSSTVEQTGTEVDCAGRTAEYSAWYELYPAYPVYFKNVVRPGDSFTGSVTYSGGQFTITLADVTAKWSQTYTQAVASAVRSSAEVIAEAPSSSTSGNVLPLTNFGTVNFTGATVNGTTNLCSASGVSEITMPSVSVSSLACPGNFSVSYTGGGTGWPPWPWY